MAQMKPDDIMDQEDVARVLGVATRSLRTMRSQPAAHRQIDGLPAPFRTVSARPVWRRVDIEQWLAAKG